MKKSPRDGVALVEHTQTRGECKLFLTVLYGIFCPARLEQIGLYLNGFTSLQMYQSLGEAGKVEQARSRGGAQRTTRHTRSTTTAHRAHAATRLFQASRKGRCRPVRDAFGRGGARAT